MGKSWSRQVSVAAVMVTLLVLATSAHPSLAGSAPPPASAGVAAAAPPAPAPDFPLGTATPSEACGACHQAIYREFATGYGSDLHYSAMAYQSATGPALMLPANVSGTPHAAAGVDPFPIHARAAEEQGRPCNVCHFPQTFDLPPLDRPEVAKPVPRPSGQEAGGLTCASCHLTPDGRIRGPYAVSAPHATVADPGMQTAAICAYCHALGKRVVGKQTQTFLEWREDFNKPSLGRQQCQDCHMPRTLRKVAEAFDVPVRAVARHLWTGGHSTQRLRTALSLVIVQPAAGQPKLEFHVVNIGAGHSVPTGSNRRAVYLRAELLDGQGNAVATQEWMFAPWYGDRPDDRAFLEQDKQRPDAIAAMQADAQGPHETPIRAGEERILAWAPAIGPGQYAAQATLIYDLNRYNERTFTGDQTEIFRASLPISVQWP